ncbi:hypothetical protein RJ639_018078 [Escallonia herrerae]|uniref:Plant bHLH transcription factor ACT-like domain-containing protein n=1 Tax=Escallonia herrerae TaxID=1293975 RepID=A0AA89AIB8_9ASTE|nr:hypothetical protein RJ639_018078 [Escallonia herrerae]
MVSREHKKAALHEKLQLLRSITNSHALSETSIVVDASKYIKELKQRVERLNQDIAYGENSGDRNSWPAVAVETLEKGFLVNIHSEKSCPRLLVSILEVFEGLGLNVLEARVSCTDTFRLEALGGENDENGESIISAQMVKQAVSQAIKNWSESNEQE